MNHITAPVLERSGEMAPHNWPSVDPSLRPRLVFTELGTQAIINVSIRSTAIETNLQKRKEELLNTFVNSTEGLNIQRVERFLRDQGLRVPPYRFLDQQAAQLARRMGIESFIRGYNGGYLPDYNLALLYRNPSLEAINGPEFTESVAVHEFMHATNAYHDLVYRESFAGDNASIRHARSGLQVYDCHGKERGRLIEEAGPERKRGQYVENDLERPYGFLYGTRETKFLLHGSARIDKKYGVRLPDGRPYVFAESYAAQIFDLLCDVDPEIDESLSLARESSTGLRNLARRLNNIQSGLYVYLRDAPFRREEYRQRLLCVQGLVRHLRPRSANGKASTLLAS